MADPEPGAGPDPVVEAPVDVSPALAEVPAGPSPEERRDRIKAAIFFFGAIALTFVLKLLLGY